MGSRAIADLRMEAAGFPEKKWDAIYMATQCRSSCNSNAKFTPLKTNINLNYVSRFSWYRTVNTLIPDNKKQLVTPV
jgi:hypothetical protein